LGGWLASPALGGSPASPALGLLAGFAGLRTAANIT